MSEIVTASSNGPLPLPRVPIVVRAGTPGDVPFMDALQKKQTKNVGWMPTATLEGKIKLGHVLVAEGREVASGEGRVASESSESCLTTHHSPRATPLGYLIGNDQYFKRDDVGIIYQVNVVPGHQRGFVGASLLKAQFERSAYGCRLYCCWCAQDIAANKFWEAMGFVPLAFRTGSRTKGAKGTSRTHIFWQRRIRAGDVSTPWWFPSQTSGGSIREDRLVLPIPPGVHWSDAMPELLPSEAPTDVVAKALPGPRAKKKPPVNQRSLGLGALSFSKPAPVKEKKPKPQRKPIKNDPQRVAAVRELRDRWLERVNEMPIEGSSGKYDVSRALGRTRETALPAASSRGLLAA